MSEGPRPGTVRAGDLEVFYLERGSGVPVLLLHGNWSTSSWWEPTLARAPEGVRAIACDLRGRGRTRGPDSSYSIASLAGDVASFAAALGLGRYHVVGHSLGSAVAMQLALERQGDLLSLTAVAPSWIDGMPARFHSEAQQRALAADRALLGRALKALAPGAAADAFWERIVDEGHGQRIEAAVRNLDALTEWAPGDRLSSLALPKLVISGGLDLLVGREVPARVAEVLSAPHIVIEQAGHCLPVEAPDRFADALFSSLTALSSG